MMRKDFIETSLGILAAFVVYTVLFRVSPPFLQVFNVLSLAVIYFAVIKGEIFGACLGTLFGLIQDSFSFGVFGVAGIAKTITGFLAGYVSRKIEVTPFLRRFVFIFILISLDLCVWIFLYTLIFSKSLNSGGGRIFFQPLGTAVLGSFVFILNRWRGSKTQMRQ